MHIGGTDYDRKLSLERVMPLLGLRHRGPTGREVPSGTFFDLSTWHLINWLYSPKALRQADDLRTSYADTALHDRLMKVLNGRLGHRIASEVEQAKIRSSLTDGATTIDLSCIEPALEPALDAEGMTQDLGGLLAQVVQCAQHCVLRAGLTPDRLDSVYLTGGSSALRPFQDMLREAFPRSDLVVGDLFGGVASGLAYAGRRR